MGPVPASFVRVIPLAALIGCAWAMGWVERGSIDAGDWLGYAVLAALVLAMILLSGGASRPERRALWGLGLLGGFAVWAALSSLWSPVPSLARDEALLTALYAVAFAVPLLTLRTPSDRLAATAVLVAGMATLALATAVKLRFAANTLDLFGSGRLAFPISYTNAQAALYLIAFWPAIALAARRRTHVALRSLGVGAATALLAGWLLAQSKGGIIALVASMIVFFALYPARLRVLVPTLLTAALVAIAAGPLTAPYRAETDAVLRGAIRHGGTTLIWLSALGALVGLAYAVLDRRVTLSPAAGRLAGRVALAALAAGLVGGVGAFFVAVGRPGHFFSNQWSALKHTPAGDPSGTHLLTLGSNRYDYWVVALGEFREHPFAGDGARSFGPVYLQKRHSPETPARAHSLPIEVLMEDGIVGLLLLGGAIGLPLSMAAGRARRRHVPAAAAFAGGVYWLVHSFGDWIWTFPAAGIPFFCLLAIGASPEEELLVRRRKARPAAIALVALAVLGFMPVWIAAKLTARGIESGSLADLRWAQRFDPLSVEPLVAKATLARSAAERIPPLEEAIDKQPRSAAIHFLLGEAYLETGRRDEAIRALEEAQRLDPLDELIRQALRRARAKR